MDVTLSVWQALLIAIWVALVESRVLGFATLTMRFSPLMTGMMVGFIMGDIKQAMIVTAAIQLVYMGFVAPGGALPAEPAIGAAIAVPVALLGHMSPQGAIAIAVPVALLGSYLYQFRFFLNTFALKPMDKYAREGNAHGLRLSIIGIPTLISFVLFIPLIFIALYFGAPVISSLVSSIAHGTVIHVLNTVGGGLAALGIAIIMQVIGKTRLLPFFFLAYFMSVAFAKLNINMTIYAIFGVIFAILYVTLSQKNASDNS
ncbi:PTS sorbose transporter subunit IIC [Paucilactobacillus hokkaidonensis JCM 18461]|uniref:PTS sorbose transporter subunit IIC n=2 Tax=Paucilactobacillus hokkaidonensis TaxID=1193095 RepID=A0A0A1GSY3_9LACO|nr:PTS sugar transporter subunit IIC [Paucilactobacillus hokkaidonensis]KRO09262.1 phosphotransferase system PTS sorbose-specific IIC subunit [Paucilactobacillus hokkaidonensis]BAP85407.1 PTS sorbose transporter subunit IIC [Paucilactobacillus hokkaidonensis JCM 18461]